MATANCSLLTVRQDFGDYAQKLLQATDGDLQLLSPCRREVCTALWGAENGDISGIGMIIGYILDHLLGLLLAMPVVALNRRSHPALLQALERGLAAFHDCASFFAFSIEIASMFILIKADLGISTNGMGDDTTRIAYAVAMLVLLPLVYTILAGLAGPARARDHSPDVNVQSGREPSHSKPLMLFVLCWALAFYPFYSAMNAAFGPSLISSGEHAALSTTQFRTIEDMCFHEVHPVSRVEARIMISFVLLTYIPLSIVLIGTILWSGIQSNHKGSALEHRLQSLGSLMPSRIKDYGILAGLAVIPSVAAGHLWAIFRARQAQKQLARSLGGADEDDNWTFGQVAAVTLFAPVFFECWNEFVACRKNAGRILIKVKATNDKNPATSL